MLRRFLHILLIAVLALNLMGAWALAAVVDCGMDCCRPGDWAGTTSYESPTCCQMSGVTCGFESGRFEERFDKAICCHNTAHKISAAWSMAESPDIPAPPLPHPPSPSEIATGPPLNTPVYISNASFLC